MPNLQHSHGDRESQANPEEAKRAVEHFTKEVDERLRPALDAACASRDETIRELGELEQMARSLHVIDMAADGKSDDQRRKRHDESGHQLPSLETRVNIGEEFYVRAQVYDLDRVVVDVGLGILLEMTRSEAAAFVTSKRHSLEEIADKYGKRISQIQSHLESVLNYLSQLKLTIHASKLPDDEKVQTQD